MKPLFHRIGPIVLGLLTAAMLAACDSGQGPQADAAQEERTKPLVMRLGALGSSSDNSIQSYPIKKFIEEVKSRTNQMVVFEYFPDGQLGGEPEMMDQILTGSLDAGALSANVLGTVWPALYGYNLPFAFRDLDHFWAIAGMDTPFAKAMQAAVNDSGKAVFVSSFSASFRGAQNRVRPIREADDFKGLKMRVMAGEIFGDMFRALGASTAAVPFGELYTSLQQGVVDGEDVASGMFFEKKFYEVEKHLTELNMTPTVNALVLSTKAWKRLTEKEREIVIEAAREAEKASHAAVTRLSQSFYGPLAEKGVTIVRNRDLTENQRASFVKATAPLWDKYRQTIGDEIYRAYEESNPK